jgi:transposase-like protein
MTAPASTEQVANVGAPNEPKRRGRSPLRKLSDEQELELTRLYSDTETAVPEIARRFAVGESSVYRIAQRHGASLRTKTGTDGRAPSKPAAKPAVRQPRADAKKATPASPGRGRRSAAPSAAAAVSATQQRRATPVRPRATAPRRAVRRNSTPAASASRAASGAQRRFRVVFRAEATIAANTMRDAVAQAEARGATEIISVSQAD